MERSEKESEVQFISAALAKAQVALCADYRGLTVAEITKLRKKLRENGASARVVKNTLISISAKQTFSSASQAELDKFLSIFKGPTLLIASDSDPVAPAKVLADFLKETKDKFSIKGGWIDGACLDAGGVNALAKMPGKKETLAQLLNLIMAPATQFVRLLQAPGQQVVQVLGAHQRKMEEGAGTGQ